METVATTTLTPSMPSNQQIAFNAIFFGVDPAELAVFYANYCAKLAGDSAEFWQWRHRLIKRDDIWSTIATETYPHDFVNHSDIPSEFYEAISLGD